MLVPLLLAALAQQTAATQTHSASEALSYLMRHQSKDGSWGGPVEQCTCTPRPTGSEGDLELTCQVVLAFLSYGYTDRGRHEQAVHIGKAMEWIAARQKEDGTFAGHRPSTHALATLTVVEYYGMTLRRKEAATKALKALVEMKGSDTRFRLLTGAALMSARLGELREPDRELQDLSESLADDPDPLATAGHLFLAPRPRIRDEDPRLTRLYAIDPAKADPFVLLWSSAATLLTDGGKRWHDRFRQIRETISATQGRDKEACGRGSWPGTSHETTVEITALRAWMLEHSRCFHCRNPWIEK